ncbi:MAG TPA: PIG-L family deacetylase [Thermoleophilia bacterium]|nr:PIG-L family deacetylase [Thermoleophilia bacterium]
MSASVPGVSASVPGVSPPAPGASLFLLAHHDDEVFCSGALVAALATGRRVKLLWATAGGLAPAARRLAEGRRVQRLLALPDVDVRLLGLPDQHAVEHLDRLAAEAADMMHDVDAVYVTAWEGGHPDHDAMNLVAARLREWTAGVDDTRRATLAGGAPHFFEFGLYRRGRGGLAVKTPVRPDEPLLDASALALRRALTHADSSQWPSLGVLAAAGRLQGTWATEPLRELPADREYSLPPAPEPLLYRLYTRWDFAGFRRAAGL